MDIGKRLKEFREKTHTKMPAIAAATGISKENLYKWEKGTKPSDFNMFKKLEEYLEERENAPVHTYEEPRINGSAQLKKTSSLFTGIVLSHDEESTPIYDTKAVPGSIITVNEKAVLIAWRFDAPVFGNVDGWIPITGEGMEPKFTNGTHIGIRKLRYKKIIIAGNFYYIVDRNLQGVVRRALPSAENNSLILIAENEKDHPETVRSWDDVLAIFSIEARIIK